MAEEMQTYGQTNESVVIYQSADNAVRLDVQLAEETVWLSQKQMTVLFDSTVPNISMHIRNIFKEEELVKEATVKNFLIVQNEGGRAGDDRHKTSLIANTETYLSIKRTACMIGL